MGEEDLWIFQYGLLTTPRICISFNMFLDNSVFMAYIYFTFSENAYLS